MKSYHNNYQLLVNNLITRKTKIQRPLHNYKRKLGEVSVQPFRGLISDPSTFQTLKAPSNDEETSLLLLKALICNINCLWKYAHKICNPQNFRLLLPKKKDPFNNSMEIYTYQHGHVSLVITFAVVLKTHLFILKKTENENKDYRTWLLPPCMFI